MTHLKDKTVLVTGAGGFIGSHLVQRLSKVDGIQLLLLSRRQRQSFQKNVTWLQGALSDLTSEYWRMHGVNHIDMIFHLGGFIPKITSDVNNVDRVFEDNLEGTRTLLEGLPLGVERMVYSSTVDVYAPPFDGEVLTEKSTVDPAGLYGASKLFCERMISVWAAAKGSKYSILRYGHIFGPGEDAFDKLIPLLIKQLLSGKPPVIYGHGNAKRDFLYIADVVEASIRAAVGDDDVGPVNIVRGASSSIKEIAELLIALVEASVKINFLPKKPDGNSLLFDNGMMVKKTGSWQLMSLRAGLAEEVKSFRRMMNE